MVKWSAFEMLGGKLGWTLPDLKSLQGRPARYDVQQVITEKANPAQCAVLTCQHGSQPWCLIMVLDDDVSRWA